MSLDSAWEIQQAVYARLVDQLAGMGDDGGDPPIFDHVPRDPDRLHLRLDGFNYVSRPIKADKTRHYFSVRIFDRPTSGAEIGRGQRAVKLLLSAVKRALDGWDPGVSGAAALIFETADMLPDDGHSMSADVRFSLFVGPPAGRIALAGDEAGNHLAWAGDEAGSRPVYAGSF